MRLGPLMSKLKVGTLVTFWYYFIDLFFTLAVVNGDRHTSVWLFLTVCFAPLVTFLNIYCIIFGTRGLVPSYGGISHAKAIEYANSLRRSNMYIGLDSVDNDVIRTVLPDNLHIFPHVFQPVNQSQSHQVFPFDGRPRITFNGKVSPGEPHVIINKDVSLASLELRRHTHRV